MLVNEATGEVDGVLAGVPIKLHATLPRVAAFQVALGVSGLGAMVRLIQEGDGRALYHGLRSLMVGNPAVLDKMIVGRVTGEAGGLILAALTAGLPEATEKKAAAGETTPSPGTATDSLPTAS